MALENVGRCVGVARRLRALGPDEPDALFHIRRARLAFRLPYHGLASPDAKRLAPGALTEEDFLRVLVSGKIVVGAQLLADLDGLGDRGSVVHALEPFLQVWELGKVLALVLVGSHPGIAGHVGNRIGAGEKIAILEAGL